MRDGKENIGEPDMVKQPVVKVECNSHEIYPSKIQKNISSSFFNINIAQSNGCA